MTATGNLIDHRITGLYLHFPFCVSRCKYCNFPTQATESGSRLMDDYTFMLANHVRRLSKAGLVGNLKTMYLGGGTPSYAGNNNLTSLLYMISLKVNLLDDTEITLEANPDSFDRQMLRDLWALGVNRYSLGVQSFDDEVLKVLGRAHSARQAEEAIDLLNWREANFSIDLMCGIPGQSPDSFLADVSHAIELGARHVSVYPLTIEEGTPFAAAVKAGRMDTPDDDLQADEMLAARKLLEQAGLERYEVASYAYPGFESRHNTGYWTGRGYVGFGTAAASMVTTEKFGMLVDAGIIAPDSEVDVQNAETVRFTCTAGAEAFSQDMTMPVSCETLSRREAILEQVMLRMRLASGLDDSLLADASQEVSELSEIFAGLEADGLAAHDAESASWKPTDRGWLLGNELFSRIWNLA